MAQFDVWVGSESGVLKAVRLADNITSTVARPKEVKPDLEICQLVWASKLEDQLLVALKNGTVKTFGLKEEVYVDELAVAEPTHGRTVGLGVCEGFMACCQHSGRLTLWSGRELIGEVSVGPDINRMAMYDHGEALVAVGGKENDLKVYNPCNLMEPVFKARNLPDDSLSLRRKVNIKDICFLSKPNLVVTATHFHQIRLYDCNVKRRPVLDISWEQQPINSICSSSDDRLLFVSNTVGSVGCIDIRKGMSVGSYKDCSGSVRCLRVHPSMPYLLSCGLDRYLRVHHTRTRELIKKVHLVTRLNSLVTVSEKYEVSESKEYVSDED